MSTIDEKRAAFHQYLATSGVISALSKALIKLYEEPNKPDDPVNFVRRHMGSEDFFILGDGKVQTAEEEELVLSSLIEKRSEETVVENVEPPESEDVVKTEEVEDDKPSEDAETVNVDAADGTEEADVETTVEEVDELSSQFEKLKSNEDCNSIVKTHLTDELFEKLKSVNSDTLYDCLKSGFEHHDSVIGIYAPDLQCYDLFGDIFDPVIETFHGFGKEAVQPSSDWGDYQTFEPINGSDEIVGALRVICVRNLQEYPVVCKMEETDLNDSLAKIKAITEGFEEASKGTFYEMAELTDDQETELKNIGGLMENQNKFLASANVYQQWPVGRGVFVADDKSMIIHVNGEDHLKFVSTESGNEFAKTYQRLVETIGLFDLPFVRHDRLGWSSFSPSNLGTALKISIDLKLPKLHADPDKLQEIVKGSPMQLKLSASEAEATYTLSNESTMGYTEFDLTKQFYDVVQAIIECENSAE